MPKQSLLIQCALVVLFSLLLLWTVPASADQAGNTAGEVKNVYICGCGPACGCNMVSEQPGKCPCGKALIEKQVLREDADKVYVCACEGDCKCGLNQADPSKCACNKELRAYPKTAKPGCAHGMPTGGCDKPCCAKIPAQAK